MISIMGGGLLHGNWTPAAEFNIFVDPEAADVVFKSGVPLMMCGLDVTEQALIYPEEWVRCGFGGEAWICGVVNDIIFIF